MTENEAIKILVTEKYCLDKSTKGLCKINCGDCKENISIAYQEKAYEMAISALKKIQQYQEIGSVEECKELASMVTQEKKNVLGKIVDEWNEYIEIGTVEECREAVEKQKPKAPKDSLKIEPVIDENGAYVDADTTVYILCPNCGELVGMDEDIDRFCRECGQAILREGEDD